MNCALQHDVSSGWSTCSVLTAYRISASENFQKLLGCPRLRAIFRLQVSHNFSSIDMWFSEYVVQVLKLVISCECVCGTEGVRCTKHCVNCVLLDVSFRVEVLKKRDLISWIGRQCCSGEMSIRTLAGMLRAIVSACSWKIFCGLCIMTPLQIGGATYL